MSATSQESAPEVVTSAHQQKKLNAEVVTTMAAAFLKSMGHKSALKPKRVSLEGEVYTVEVDTKKFTAVVRISAVTREIKGYDVQPKSEENSFFSFSPNFLLTVAIVSAIISVGLYFALKMFGL